MRLETAVAQDLSLDERLQAWATALEAQRSGLWDAVRAVALMLYDAPNGREKTKRVNLLASNGHCTSAFVRQHYQLHLAYGERAAHLTDVSFALLRACIPAAKRLKRDAFDVLQEALTKGVHAAEVGTWGVAERRMASFVGECGNCTTKVTYRLSPAKDFRGRPVQCGVCREPLGKLA